METMETIAVLDAGELDNSPVNVHAVEDQKVFRVLESEYLSGRSQLAFNTFLHIVSDHLKELLGTTDSDN